MAQRNPQDASALVGVDLSFFAATSGAGGDTTVGGAGVILLAHNGSGSPVDVVLVTPETVEGTLPVGDRTRTIPATTYASIPIPSRYNDPATGLAKFTWSAVATVEFAVFRTSVAG